LQWWTYPASGLLFCFHPLDFATQGTTMPPHGSIVRTFMIVKRASGMLIPAQFLRIAQLKQNQNYGDLAGCCQQNFERINQIN